MSSKGCRFIFLFNNIDQPYFIVYIILINFKAINLYTMNLYQIHCSSSVKIILGIPLVIG